MTDKIYRDVAPVSGEDRAAILRKTAHSLPDSPSAAGMKPDQIRKHFWSAIAGERQSVLYEIDRVARETNAALDAIWALLYGTVELGGKEIRLSDLIYTGLAEGYTLSDLLGGLADGSALTLISSGVPGYSMEQYLAMLKREIDRKAQKGDKGDPGDAAGFGEITVETVTEEPDQAAAVEVVADGEDVAKNFRFVFRIPQGKTGERGLQGLQGVQGVPGIQGPQGKPFGLAKIYASEAEMNADFNNPDIEFGDFVMINTGDVEDEENSRIYVKTEDKYSYVTDMSGAAGIQGPQGPQGIQGNQGLPGKDGKDGEVPIIGANGNWWFGGLDSGVRASADAPTFNLVSLGLPVVPMDGTMVNAEADTTDIVDALDKGAIKIIAAFGMGASTVTAEVVMGGIHVGAMGVYICSYPFDFEGMKLMFNLVVGDGVIGAYYSDLSGGLPEATEGNEGKVLRVVNGVWTAADIIVKCTQSAYDALVAAGTVDESVIYVIVG